MANELNFSMYISLQSFYRLIPMAAVMGIIFFLSHQPADQLYLPEIPFLDKMCHFSIYGLLALATLNVPTKNIRFAKRWKIVVGTILICFLYGITDEFHQYFIPGRDVSAADLLADFCGAAFVSFIWLKFQKIGF